MVDPAENGYVDNDGFNTDEIRSAEEYLQSLNDKAWGHIQYKFNLKMPILTYFIMHIGINDTVCPGSSDPFYIVIYFITSIFHYFLDTR